RWTGSAEVLGVTDGPAGARIHTDGQEICVPAYRADEIDPTGAGDIWVAACLIRLVETGDPVEAARFANAAGSVSVEREGLSGAPTRAEIEARMAIGPS
ncbi:MAG: carbohydrate kinase family protein, partial [Chloroflexi bacterium]|nr:carbohydrate kinase family protein [Chloroflexota bacterium]